MMKNFLAIITILTTIVLSSCDKEKHSRNQFAGIWKIEKMTQTFYSDSSQKPQPDSVIVSKDAGVFMLVDRADFGNKLNFDDSTFGKTIPKFYQVGGGGWSTDFSGTRLSLSGVVYSVEDLFLDRFKLTYISGIYGGLFSFKEELIINRINP